MAKRKNYGFEKRQVEMAKKAKQEEKRARKAAEKAARTPEETQGPAIPENGTAPKVETE